MDRVEEIEKKRWRALLTEHADKARLSRDLARLRSDVPVTFDYEALTWSPEPTPELLEHYRELEFRSLIQNAGGVQLERRETDYGSIRDVEALWQFVTEARKAGRFAIDTETTGLDPHSDRVVGISVSYRANWGRYIPIGHLPEAAGGTQLSAEVVREVLGPLLADPQVGKIFHNAKFDLNMLRGFGLSVQGIACDTMLAPYLLRPGARGLGLKQLALERLGVEMTSIGSLIGKGDLITMEAVRVSEAEPYACQDADLTLQLF